MAMEYINIQMAMFMMANGKMEKSMAREHINMQMTIFLKANGKMG